MRQIDARLTIPLQRPTNLTWLLPKPGGGERPIVLRSPAACAAEQLPCRRNPCLDAARARFWDSAVRGCSALQCAIRRRLLQEGGGHCERVRGINWDLEKFYDSIDVRHLLRSVSECGFLLKVFVVDLQVRLPSHSWLQNSILAR